MMQRRRTRYIWVLTRLGSGPLVIGMTDIPSETLQAVLIIPTEVTVTAMHSDVLIEMSKRIEVYKNRMVDLIPFEMTHQECIRLIAPSEHISMLIEAAKVADIKMSEDWMMLMVPGTIDGEVSCAVQLFMRTHGQKEPPLRPRTPFWQTPVDRAMSVAGEKIIAWLTKRFELGRRFGTALHVLNQLDSICESGTQMRYLFPAVLQLCTVGKNIRMDRWMEKHAVYKPVRYAPVVSPQLKGAIQDASAVLTSAVLMGDDVQGIEQGEVLIHSGLLPSFKFEDTHISRM